MNLRNILCTHRIERAEGDVHKMTALVIIMRLVTALVDLTGSPSCWVIHIHINARSPR
jgi:hypothetical protein